MQQHLLFMGAGLLAAAVLTGIAQLQAANRPHQPGGPGDREALQLGYRVQAVREAIQNPEAPHALQAVTDLGHDQRYYVMVRGWLAYQRQGDMSIVAANRGREPEYIRARINFLDRAIRAIDLE